MVFAFIGGSTGYMVAIRLDVHEGFSETALLVLQMISRRTEAQMKVTVGYSTSLLSTSIYKYKASN